MHLTKSPLTGYTGLMKRISANELNQPEFLPMSGKEMEQLGWDEIDVLIVTGDAYVDHPSFGPALLGRWLAAHGFRTGLIAQPDWRNPESVTALGRPRPSGRGHVRSPGFHAGPFHRFS